MHCAQYLLTEDSTWQPALPPVPQAGTQLLLAFGSPALYRAHYPTLRQAFPQAILTGCSTAGEIADVHVLDDSLSVVAIDFAHTALRSAKVLIADHASSYACGQVLANRLMAPDLCHVLVLSDGLQVNGSQLVAGLKAALPAHIVITGGLAGDGARFHLTEVFHNDFVSDGLIVALGFYGEHLRVGYGSLGGWDAFGPERLITRSEANVLYALDNQSALELYKTYLGEHAAGLPATGLLFPLCIRPTADAEPVVRTILAVDDAAGSMTFAGDMPEGWYARLMRANFDRLIDGATYAARHATSLVEQPAALALLISCVGRKMVLKQRIEEEVESVRDVLGPQAILTGFYSYGEISPLLATAECTLHNQTMTITTFSEV